MAATSVALPVLLVFGPQAAPQDPESLARLRLVLLSEPGLCQLLSTIRDLPQLWRSLIKEFPSFQAVPGLSVWEDFNGWIHTGANFPQALHPLPNVLLTPLTVIMHIANYVHYVRVKYGQKSQAAHEAILKDLAVGGAHGLCVGLLSAIAVACSATLDELGHWGSVALRLAVCIGAAVDLEGAYASPPNEASCFSVRYDPDQRDIVQRILKNFPEAYISVNVDSAHVTITTAKSTAPLLMQAMSAADCGVKLIALDGRFHTPRHKDALARLLAFCTSRSTLLFPSAGQLKIPIRSNTTGQLLTGYLLHNHALASLLTDLPDWSMTMDEAAAGLVLSQRHVLAIGTPKFIPHSIVQNNHLRVTYLHSFEFVSFDNLAYLPNPLFPPMQVPGAERERPPSEDDIAVIGMACRFPGANNIEEFWESLDTGKSMCQPLPESRFSTWASHRVRTGATSYWGNFLEDPAAFDHRFFGMSSREAASTDPQQRLVLEVAYEALESAGYFDELSKGSSIGCYLGVGSVDYGDNVSSHPPTAFSAVGTLRAFVSGKISHNFGWTGPSITYDTACSSSAVAIHSACVALRSGECSGALAGGVNIITSPILHQNLDKGGFLSPTGASKAFDAKADGYCRGEGAGLVVLKKLSAAVVDGDTIFGVIAGSAVGQNENCTPITVPHSRSQAELYYKATKIANIDPMDVSFVEAHGTGTKVGDPVECESIRQVFGGSQRRGKLYFGSVKANIGHTEGASGVAGLIKSLLMMQKQEIPVQPNFTVLNSNIPPLLPDKMAIPTVTQRAKLSSICINNYGAAGSNAVLILCAPPSKSKIREERYKAEEHSQRFPIIISAHSADSVRAYCTVLRQFLSIKATELDLPSLAFNLAHRVNHALPNTISTTASSLSELKDELWQVESGAKSHACLDLSVQKPVILSFGGQTQNTLGLDKGIYLNTLILKAHLDTCNAVCCSLGGEGLFPSIFDKKPLQDIVLLHSMIFSLQYSCARAWVDCGLKVDAVIGHSFGQFTALCVAGSISLEQALRLVMGRARLIQERLCSEKGGMLSIEANSEELSEIGSLVQDSGYKFEIACYNSETNHTLVGSEESIHAIEHVVQASLSLSRSVKLKRLNVTHGYHSHLLEPMLPELVKLADDIEYHEPKIHVETTTRDQSWCLANSTLIAQHSREPVYFLQAVRRIEKRFGACIWLEAGSDSTITNMTRRALGPSLQAGHIFQPVSLSSLNSIDQLANTTVNLWNAGLSVQYWPFHRLQRGDYAHTNLPPYQFEKSGHWLEYKEIEDPIFQRVKKPAPDEYDENARKMLTFISFMRPQTMGESLSEFAINPESEEFKHYVGGHSVLGRSLCPASLYIHLATKAAFEMLEEASRASHTLSVESLDLESPLGFDEQRAVSLKLREADDIPLVWTFTISSYDLASLANRVRHATGTIRALKSADRKLKADFRRYERLTASRYADLIAQNEKKEADSSVEGPFIYKAFSSVVNYSDYYRGVKMVSSRGFECVGRISMPARPLSLETTETFWDPLLVDNFLQVTGLHINCLREKLETEVFVCTKIDELRVNPDVSLTGSQVCSVFSSLEQSGDKELMSDIFILEPGTAKLAFVVLGACFTKVSTSSLEKALARVNANGNLRPSSMSPVGVSFTPPSSENTPASITFSAQIERGRQQDSSIPGAVRELLNRVTDVPMELIHDDTALETIGVDSLMTTEVLDELNETFGIRIAMHELQSLADFKSLCILVGSKNPPDFYSLEEDSNTAQISLLRALEPPVINQSVVDIIEHQDTEDADEVLSLELTLGPFIDVRHDFDRLAGETTLRGFYSGVYPRQAELVVSYIIKAFETFGIFLSEMSQDQTVPRIPCLPEHQKVTQQIYHILCQEGIVCFDGPTMVRTGQVVSGASCEDLLNSIMQDFPQHALEHKLLSTTGRILGDCLSGKSDPLQVLFRSKSNRDLLGDVYSTAPMFATATRLLTNFLSKFVANVHFPRPIRILEVGAGTGGTTKDVLKQLRAQGVPFIYTFTDLSSSLVADARKSFASYGSSVEFMVLNIEEDPPINLLQSQDIVISTNCIHATKNIERSCFNINQLLRKGGILCLIELTRNLYWFDLVFGLLEGWWRFDDSRNHALAHESFWKESLQTAGFSHVDWSRGQSKESELIRLIIAVTSESEAKVEPEQITLPVPQISDIRMETILFKHVGRIPLYADIYYPEHIFNKKTRLPIAIMIHGGGHVMLSRKDIRPLQTKLLLDNGLLPISIDHRLCPEVDLLEGPMTDVCSALEWARKVLPTLELERADIQADGSKVVVIGWSTGGTLAMSAGWMAPVRGLRPPEAILVFYCPTDYQSEWWTRPHFPWGTSQADADRPYDIWETVRDTAITGLNIASARAIGGWMSTSDPRARIPLHMKWTAHGIPILLGALTSRQKALRQKKDPSTLSPLNGHSTLPFPTKEEIAPISPRAQIVSGVYRTPTYLIHGTADEFISWKESRDTYAALLDRGIPAGFSVVEGAEHIFEMRGIPKGDPAVGRAVLDGYRFVLERVGVDIGDYGKDRDKW